ncbi:fibroblast growth factor receptor 3-like [Octopus sinensis]|uniref:Fibroblast growth factor receptor 3-like n=1 Tax=Octopus sinensis TaxID=2607531 RepID=A0A6P7TII0_9MOLL|nr:fibroblast growth factor receptor 3-like [Octopus sinensis]
MEVSLTNLTESSQFWLLAVNSFGVVAEERFPVKSIRRFREVFSENSMKSKSESSKRRSRGKLFYIQEKITEINNSLSVVLQMREKTGLTSQSKNRNIDYYVNWFLENCGIYKDVRKCGLPKQHYGPVHNSSTGGQVQVILPNIMYNSLYSVKIEASEGIRTWIHDFKIKTPKCLHTHRFFTGCNQTKYTNSSKIQKWFPSIESLVYNKTVHKIIGNFSWMAPINRTNIKYLVAWQAPGYMDQSNILLAGKVKCEETSVLLVLEPSFIYKIKVTAVYQTNAGTNKSAQSSPLYVNTTISGIISEKKVITRNIRLKENVSVDNVNTTKSPITGIICAAVLFVMFTLLAVVYRRRKNLKNTVISKTTVAKSNSYKSNVTGCKSDYANDLQVTNDEWEIDTRQLKFSTPIGEGAFGKVVIGYYSQEKVAIKLVRDCAPLSYKEDFLAELDLMKKIGKHPNIVAMIGACTLSEPIALIMEYLPYGNLHNFLQRCRLDGQPRKNIEDGYTEMTYSVKDDDGTIHEEVISPVDILSFARQVAMAMEYMHSMKYLHRDLAARNVLLDYKKVVKVCDFGLSRDIYNDDQYQKLTSGKLPIKWMAMESLRDRMFTTKTDVWSFGILLWEIVTMGASPYPSIALADLYEVLATGYRMEKPEHCSNELYEIMRLTWREKPKDRPTFHRLRLLIENLMEKDRTYLDLSSLVTSLAGQE